MSDSLTIAGGRAESTRVGTVCDDIRKPIFGVPVRELRKVQTINTHIRRAIITRFVHITHSIFTRRRAVRTGIGADVVRAVRLVTFSVVRAHLAFGVLARNTTFGYHNGQDANFTIDCSWFGCKMKNDGGGGWAGKKD